MTTAINDLESPAASAYPTLGRRYFAAFIDGLVILGGMLLVGTLLGEVGPTFAPVRAALFVALWFGYEPGCTAFAATLGQRLMGFRVRRLADPTRRISLPAAWLRYAIKLALGIVSFITMAFTPQRRAIHDLASGSVVLDVAMLPAASGPAPASAT